MGLYLSLLRNGNSVLMGQEMMSRSLVTCYEQVRFEVEACGGVYVPDQEATRDGKIVTGKTWESHPDFYRAVFECLHSEVMV